MLMISPVMVRSCRTDPMAPQLGQSKLGIWGKPILLQAQPYRHHILKSSGEFIEIRRNSKVGWRECAVLRRESVGKRFRGANARRPLLGAVRPASGRPV